MTIDEVRHVRDLACDRGKFPSPQAAEVELLRLDEESKAGERRKLLRVVGSKYGALYNLAKCFGRIARFGTVVEKNKERGLDGPNDAARDVVLQEAVAMARVYGAKLECGAAVDEVIAEMLAANKSRWKKYTDRKGGD